MIPNLLNAIIGVWLVYAAVLNPTQIVGGRLVASGLAIFILALWAFRIDYLKWPATIAGILGASFALYGGFKLPQSSGFATFWVALFGGITIAVVSLWSALYRKPSAPEYSGTSVSQPATEEK